MKLRAATLGVILLGLCRSAGAYILDVDFIMRLLADARRDAPKAVSLTLNTELAGRDHPIDERLFFKRPERMRLVQTDDTTTVWVNKEGNAAGGEELALKAMGPSKNILANLLYPRGRDLDDTAARLLKTLAAVGIDTRVVSFGRNEEQIVYIIGAAPWEADRPQLWLDKTTFLPVRLRLPTAGTTLDKPAGVTEMRFLEYGGGSVPGIPRVFEEYQDGSLTRHAEVVSGQVYTDLPESLFDLNSVPAKRH